jgi:hypothetical protein
LRAERFDEDTIEHNLTRVVRKIEYRCRGLHLPAKRHDVAVKWVRGRTLKGPTDGLIADGAVDAKVDDVAGDGHSHGHLQGIDRAADSLPNLGEEGQPEAVRPLLHGPVRVGIAGQLADQPVDPLAHDGRREVHVHLSRLTQHPSQRPLL